MCVTSHTGPEKHLNGRPFTLWCSLHISSVVFQLLMNIDPQPAPPSLRDHEMSVFVMKACGGGADVPLQPPPVHGGSVFIKLSDFMSQHRGVVRFTVVNIMQAKLLFILH